MTVATNFCASELEEKSIERKRNSIEFSVYGKYALFSDPITRVGGEKFSYQSPTYQALKGIVASVYWKPTLTWYIDAVRVMRRIQTECKGIRPIKMSGGNSLSYYTYLRDVEYQVLAHFEWNEHCPELAYDRDEHKHHNIALRSVKRGGRRDVFLGTRECQAYVEPCVFGKGEGYYDKDKDGNPYGVIDFGVMFHGFDYPEETGKKELAVRFCKQSMENGVVVYQRPEEIGTQLRRKVRDYGDSYQCKRFERGVNFSIELVE